MAMEGPTMKKLIFVALSVNALLLAGLFWQQIPVAQGGQQVIIRNGDCNGDGVRELADAVYFLTWFFRGGPAPVRCNEPATCGGFAGTPCETGEFCDLPAGLCNGADLTGECKPVPQGCPEIFDPVCGCNGVTYANDCERQVAGVQLDHTGACDLCGGCGAGEFCYLPEGQCTGPGPGVCEPVPPLCPAIFVPVCGCDGVTYSNDCERKKAQVQLDHTGSCGAAGDFCGGIAGFPCGAGLFCDIPAGQCQVADPSGTCVTVPAICPAIFDPVCGCNGTTYDNDCERRKAQVQLDHDGACP